jgi:hypothetical protein
MARIRYINNEGGGFADTIEVPSGTTIGQFVRERVSNPGNYHIRVNGQEVAADEFLQEGARVSIVPRPGTLAGDAVLADGHRVSVTPKKIAGAVLALIATVFGDVE